MKHWKILLIIGIIVIANTGFSAMQTTDKIIAIVNNDIILQSEVNDLIRFSKFNVDKQDQRLPDNTRLYHQTLEHLIMSQILLQKEKEVGIKISEQEIDQAIANIAQHKKIALSKMCNLLSSNGIDYSLYRNWIRKELLISEIRNHEVSRRITILPQEIEILSKQLNDKDSINIELNLSHILIPLLHHSTLNQIKKIKNQAHLLIKQAHSGFDFNELANAYSSNQLILKNGPIGWVHIQELPFIFSKALKKAKKGDIIGPIRSNFGFHILKVEDLRFKKQTISVTETHVCHILLKPSPILTNIQAYKKLKQIAVAINNCRISFSNAAKSFSQDFTSSKQGGNLGWIAVTEIYDTTFRNALLELNKGQISEPIHSSYGWHLIKLINVRIVDKTDVIKKDLAYRMLFDRKFSEETLNWMQEQRTNTYVKIMINQ